MAGGLDWLAGPWNDPKGDVLVVLGRRLDCGRNRLVFLLAQRVRGSRVARGRIPGNGGNRRIRCEGRIPAAERMGEFMVSQGVPASAIRVETESHSTRENALKSKAILDQLPGSKVLMTSDYHMFRATRVFRKAGIDIAPRPIPTPRNRSACGESGGRCFWD